VAVATYNTDLATITLCEAGETYEEFTGYTLGDNAAVETDWYLQGSACASDEANNKTGVGHSIGKDYGSNVTFSAGDCFFAWMMCMAGNAMDTFANGGYRVLIGAGIGDYNGWKVGGRDFGRNPYGGWTNVVVDPAFTPVDYTLGTPGAYRHFAVAFKMTSGISKGRPNCADAMRYGRGQLYIEYGQAAAYGTFTEMASANDGSAAQWGLFQAQGTGYLWKGLISLGTSTNAVDFRDSNANITIDDTPRTYAAFNKIEVNHVNSRVDWTGINITALNASGLSIGQFECIANADINWLTCGFVDMSTFIFQSNSTLLQVTWLRCALITGAGATFTGSKILESTVAADASAFNWNVATDPDGKLDDMAFSKGTNAHHAVEFGLLSPLTMTVKGWTTTGFNASNGQNDSTFHIKRTSGTVTINVVGGTGNFSYKTAGAAVVIVINPVTLEITVIDSITKAAIQSAAVFVKAANGTGPLPFEDSVTITRSGDVATVAHTAHGLDTGKKVEIKGAVQNEYNRIKTITVTGVDAYTYLVYGSPTTPATGTIKSTGVLISGDSDVSGQISDSRTFGTNQPYTGSVKKGSSAPVYVSASLTGTVDKDNGKDVTVPMISD
jgi:hypothetical protein